MGFVGTVAGVSSGFAVGVVMDRWQLSLKRLTVSFVGLTALAMGAFVVEVNATLTLYPSYIHAISTRF
jgi:hypothetical protein